MSERFKWFFAVMAGVYFAIWLYGALAAAYFPGSPGLPVVDSDSKEYAVLSDSILHQGAFLTNAAGGSPENFRTPGYPAFTVAVLGSGGSWFLRRDFVQMTLGVSIALLVERIGGVSSRGRLVL